MSNLVEILMELLEVTQMPPVGVEIDDLIAAFETMHAKRSAILARMTEPTGPRAALGELEMSIASALETRQAVWMAHLAKAKAETSEQRIGASKLRAYAPSLSGA